MKQNVANMLNAPVDLSTDFYEMGNTHFAALAMDEFDAASGRGAIRYQRRIRKPRMAFDQCVTPFEETKSWEFPPEYAENPTLPFQIDFITERTIRLRFSSNGPVTSRESMMLVAPPPTSDRWTATSDDAGVTYRSAAGSVRIDRDPWHIKLFDATGRLLTQTYHAQDTFNLMNGNPIPFSILRRSSDLRRQFAASFRLSPDEKLFGCGESFTRLDKRGQKIHLWTQDAHGVMTGGMYKPVPFLLSSRGYGMFVHTSAPITMDLGESYDEAATVFCGDRQLDLFLFIGTPKEIVGQYTALTGRSPMPPDWSFGLWMSRITYKSEDEVREVAKELRERKIPCDVLHLDTGWFETNWQCDYQFSKSRFSDAKKMIADLREQGFHISLWQLPYFTPRNPLFQKAIEKGFVVRGPDGGLPTEDAVLDFSNPEAVRWYQHLLNGLFDQGVECIKADFGEAAPLNGIYASGDGGWLEHNLYPLRYNESVYEATKRHTGGGIIWGRSAWAGSQRYPLHWGGDAENTDCGMAATLRGGLSLGLCGFTFWSHDCGGFVKKSPPELYLRWLAMGVLTSHTRCHGLPPKEPWHFGEAFTDRFRRIVELKYRLMPYILEQSRASSAAGYPMMRPLFFEYPDDPACYLIEDQYFFGSDLLVAPLMEQTAGRSVYLPPGEWIDFQTGQSYPGARWHQIDAGFIPIVLLSRAGVTIPQGPVGQHVGAT